MTETAARTPSKQRLRLWLRMLRATRSIENDVRNLMREQYGTTLPRFDVMAALYRSGKGLTMGELSRELMVSNGNVTGIVERLEEDGLVWRGPRGGDRRTSHVELSGNGRAYFEQIAGAHEAWISRRLSGLDDEEVAEAIKLLRTIGATAERMKR